MDTNSDYTSYINAMQNFEISQGRKDYQAPYAESFESIYNKAKEEEVSLSNAKEFLQNLSDTQMKTLQKYSGLAEKIDVDSLSAEGSYNLLVHDNEQYDFNNDGVAEVGLAKTKLSVPTNMPEDVRDAYISAMNTMSSKERMMASALTLDVAYLKSVINDEPYSPTEIDYEYLKTQVENAINPKNGGYSSAEAKEAYTTFWNAFNEAYGGEKTSDTKEETNNAVEQFLKDLRTKGASKFLADLNQEKIDKLVEEYKQKLMEDMGSSPEAMQEIEKLVEDFRTKLLEEYKERMEDDIKNKKDKTTSISTNSQVQEIIDLQKDNKIKPLEELLQQYS